jgi:hypothetical protein
MPLIKLMLVEGHYCRDGWGDGETQYRLGRDVTDWEEVSAEDLAFLRKYRHQLKTAIWPSYDYNSELVIVEQDNVPVTQRIAELRTSLKAQIEKEEAAAKRAKELAAVRKEQKRLQKLAQEKKTLELLKAKYEATNGNQTT